MLKETDILSSRILIIDDEKANGVLLEMMLRREGFLNVEFTTSPVKSIELYRENRPHLVLLDLRMPEMDGFEVLETLKKFEDFPKPPVIVLTAESDDAVRLKALQAGAKDFLSKPLNLTEVLYRCRNLLEMHLLHKQLMVERNQLEVRVQQRTEDLLRANQTLKDEIFERRATQNRLKRQNLLLEMIACETSLEKCMNWIRLEGEPLSETAVGLWLQNEKKEWRCGFFWNLEDVVIQEVVKLLNENGESNLKEAIKKGGPLVDIDFPVKSSPGNYADLLMKAGIAAEWCIPLSSGDGTVLGVFSWYFNRPRKPAFNEEEWIKVSGNLIALVLERSRSLERLNRMNEQLLYSEKLSAIGKLTASLTHEFNNPIMGIRNVLEQVSREPELEPALLDLTRLAVKECSRVMRLTTRLRDFYRPSDGVLVPVDLAAAVEDMIFLKNNELVAKEITIERDFEPDLPAVLAVEDQIKQVILNLLQNAGEAAPPHTGRIRISLGLVGDQIALRIRDNGSGVNPENMDKIFDPFFTTKKDEVKGTGLGLSVSFGIVKKHGGQIFCENITEGGCEFSMLLPVSDNAP